MVGAEHSCWIMLPPAASLFVATPAEIPLSENDCANPPSSWFCRSHNGTYEDTYWTYEDTYGTYEDTYGTYAQAMPIERGAGVDQSLLFDVSRQVAAGSWSLSLLSLLLSLLSLLLSLRQLPPSCRWVLVSYIRECVLFYDRMCSLKYERMCSLL